MRLDRLTEKTQEALQAAQQLAEARQRQAILPEHLLLALIDQSDGVVKPLLQKLEARPGDLVARLNQQIEQKPTVSGVSGQAFVSSELNKVLDKAWSEMQELKD